MVDVDKVVIAAERCHAHEHVHLAEYVHAYERALEELRYRVDGGESKERADDDEGAATRAVEATEIGMTHVQVAVDGEREREPDAKRLRGRHHRIDVDENDLVVVDEMHGWLEAEHWQCVLHPNYHRKYKTNYITNRQSEQIGVRREFLHSLATEHNYGEYVANDAKEAYEHAQSGDDLRELCHNGRLIEIFGDVVQFERTQRELDTAKIEIVVVYR